MSEATIKDQKKVILLPSFGFLSSLPITGTLLPHALVTLGVIFFYKGINPVFFSLVFTILARITGDWLFWAKFFPKELDTEANEKNWRSSVKSILTSDPIAIKSMFDMVVDIVLDGVLLFIAFKITDSFLWVLFVYSLCHGIGAPVQGILIRVINRRYVKTLSMIVSVLAIAMLLELNGSLSEGYLGKFGLSEFSVFSKTLWIIGANSFCSGTSVIAKELIAETLKLETMKELQSE